MGFILFVLDPFAFVSTCFSEFIGLFYTIVSVTTNGENICSESDIYMYTSTVNIKENAMTINTCYNAEGMCCSSFIIFHKIY